MVAKECRDDGGKPSRRGFAEPLVLTAERLLEGGYRLEPDAHARRDQLRCLQRPPIWNREEMFTRSAAAQQELAPIQRFQGLGDPLGGGSGRAVDAVIGTKSGPDRRSAQAKSDDNEQSGDELKHEAHAITPNLGYLTVTIAPRVANRVEMRPRLLGQFSQGTLGMILWT